MITFKWWKYFFSVFISPPPKEWEGEITKMALRDVKVCLLGDSGVGKTSIVLRFVTNTFRENPGSTIGASFMTKTLVVGENENDKKTFRFQIWDTAGQEKYRALAPMYFRGAAAAIVVYDITKESSYR